MAYEDGDTEIVLREFPIIKQTEKTYFINRYAWGGELRRVSKSAYNGYAHRTKELAKQHFIRRTNKRISWFEFWIDECRKGLELIEDINTKEQGGYAND